MPKATTPLMTLVTVRLLIFVGWNLRYNRGFGGGARCDCAKEIQVHYENVL